MSLKPTSKNHAVVGIAYSAKEWARHAIGGDKVTGRQGFNGYRSIGSGWYHPAHYRLINKQSPGFSPLQAIEEMAQVCQRLVDEIETTATELDEMVMRLQRMEEQMDEVLENNQGE